MEGVDFIFYFGFKISAVFVRSAVLVYKPFVYN